MHGNVNEWCLDRWSEYLPGGSVTDPKGSRWRLWRSSRVWRGGSWLYDSRTCRSAFRMRRDPSRRYGFLGFRVVLAPVH